ncbi:MAG: hypothetical protein QG657_2925, partial [Acidobacteriota bacterium]|nr:hypothetical protein [Acidobacteriota bacterium]
FIYVGGNNEMGYLAHDANGSPHYISLLEYIKPKRDNFSNVWETISLDDGIYFRTTKYLFHWHPRAKQFMVWEPETAFMVAFSCSGRFFVQEKDIGLKEMVNGSLKLAAGGDIFADKPIYMMTPYDEQRILIGTRLNGFYLYDHSQATPFPNECAEYIKDKQLSHGIRLSCGDYALATLRGGLIIMDPAGNLKQVLDKSSGLQDDNIKYVFEDRGGNLWLALDKGITKIEYASPITIYDDRAGLQGIVLSVSRHGPDNTLYAGTRLGLFKLESRRRFIPVKGCASSCWALLSMGNSLLAATSEGVLQISGRDIYKVTSTHAYVLCASRLNPQRVWVGTRQGLEAIVLSGDKKQWIKEAIFQNISEPISSIIEDKAGNLWLGTPAAGVLKVDFAGDKSLSASRVNRWDILPSATSREVQVFSAAGHVIYTTPGGIFYFDELSKGFKPDMILGADFAGNLTGNPRKIFQVVEDSYNNTWFHSESKNYQAVRKPGGTYAINSTPFKRIPLLQVNSIYPDPDRRVVWLAGDDGLLRFDTGIKKDYGAQYSTLLRRVLINGRPIFNGFKKNMEQTNSTSMPGFDFEDRNINFEFAAPFFEGETETRYKWFLEGYDKKWSELSPESKKDYTNLDSRSYVFRVQAMNVYGTISSEDSFYFKILPPWYRAWWAFLIYAAAAFLMVYFIVRWRSGHLEKEKQSLEQIIKDRVKEINEKKLQLEEQSKKLEEMDHIKSRFFANISHEFRTPLTLIMGPLEQMIGECSLPADRKKLSLMLRNSQRLLSLINQLLELSKIDSGKVTLRMCLQNIVPFIKGITASFEPLTSRNEQDLSIIADDEDISLYFDSKGMEEVMFNLLINAVKFTPRGGKIIVRISRSTANAVGEVHFPSGAISISVQDTGPGIPRDQLAYIFDRFYQVDSSVEQYSKSTGIGLAIAREMVDLHHGFIDVLSQEGLGTEFIVYLPMGTGHLTSQDIVDKREVEIGVLKTSMSPPLALLDDDKNEEEFESVEGAEVRENHVDEGEEPRKPEKDIILLVEDNADVREYMRGSLVPLYAVIEAVDGKQGIEKAREIIPDLIISDIMMPHVSGYQLCRTLKNDVKTSHIPIILLTARASEESIVEGLETGADDYITKPFNLRILCARIKNLIDLRRHIQESFKREMTLQPVEISVSKIDRDFIEELKEVIEKNLSDPEFNVEDLGRRLSLSRATLYRKIHSLTGDSPVDFIRSYRLKRAAQLLKKGTLNVTDAAFEVGFSSTAYFTKCFKEKFHQVPSTFHSSSSVDQTSQSIDAD